MKQRKIITGTKYNQSFYDELNACLAEESNEVIIDALQSMSVHNQTRILDVLLDEIKRLKNENRL